MSTGASLRSGLVAALTTSSGARSQLGEAQASVRTPLARCRRVGFASVAGGSGASATAAYVSDLLAARRTGTVLGVDVSGGPVGSAWWTGTREAEVLPHHRDADVAARAVARCSADARIGLPTTPSGLHVLDLAGPGVPAQSVATWRREVDPIARFHDVVVTDWGVRPAAGDLTAVAAASQVLVLVSRAEQDAAYAGAEVISSVRAAHPGLLAVLALVDTGRKSDRLLGRPARPRLRPGGPVVTVRYDRSRSEARPVGSRSLSRGTRLDLLRLAVALMEDDAPGTARATVSNLTQATA